MRKEMKKVCVTAEAFGYGPIITCVNIIKKLRKKTNISFVFLGSGVALEQAKMSGLFADYVECETYLEKELKKQEIFRNAEWIISFENLMGAVLGVRENKHVLYVDNLFWMWDSLPEELNEVDAYFAAETTNLDKNIERVGRQIKRLFRVGPLREFCPVETQKLENRILINLGGAESFLEDYDIILSMYSVILKNFINALQNLFDGEIVVCGGNRIITELQKIPLDRTVIFKSLVNNEYLKMLKASKYLIMSPGMGNFYELMNADQKAYMLPPINYSQFLQLRAYLKEDVGISALNWDSFDWYIEVEDYLEEKEGVELVQRNSEQFLQDEESQKIICDKMVAYVSEDSAGSYQKREAFIKKCNRNGIQEVSDIIVNKLVKCQEKKDFEKKG